MNNNTSVFDREKTLLLVNLYELQPTLYCVSSPLYKHENARDIAMKTIAEQPFIKTKIKVPVSEIKVKINNLRTQFNEHYTKYEAAIHSDMGAEELEAAKPKWWLRSSMNVDQTHYVNQDTTDEVDKSSDAETLSVASCNDGEVTFKKRKSKKCLIEEDVRRDNFYKEAICTLRNLNNNTETDNIKTFILYLEPEMRMLNEEQFQKLKREIMVTLITIQDEKFD